MKKIINYIKNHKFKTILLVTLSISFIALSILVITEKTLSIDLKVHTYIINLRSEELTHIFKTLTNFANASFLLGISTILFIIIKNKKIPLYILINLTLSFLVNEIMKNIITRSRPIGINLIEETGYSFPSGHTMVSLSFYSFIVYLLLKNIKNKPKKITLIISLIIFVTLIGFSRIYLGVHYLTDIIAGLLLSSIYLIIFISIHETEKKWSNENNRYHSWIQPLSPRSSISNK